MRACRQRPWLRLLEEHVLFVSISFESCSIEMIFWFDRYLEDLGRDNELTASGMELLNVRSVTSWRKWPSQLEEGFYIFGISKFDALDPKAEFPCWDWGILLMELLSVWKLSGMGTFLRDLDTGYDRSGFDPKALGPFFLFLNCFFKFIFLHMFALFLAGTSQRYFRTQGDVLGKLGHFFCCLTQLGA